MTAMKKTVLAAALGAGALAFSASGALADFACTGNVCWHVHEHYKYPSEAHVVVHEDSWHHGPNVVIREHEGRGYWRGDTWTAW